MVSFLGYWAELRCYIKARTLHLSQTRQGSTNELSKCDLWSQSENSQAHFWPEDTSKKFNVVEEMKKSTGQKTAKGSNLDPMDGFAKCENCRVGGHHFKLSTSFKIKVIMRVLIWSFGFPASFTAFLPTRKPAPPRRRTLVFLWWQKIKSCLNSMP